MRGELAIDERIVGDVCALPRRAQDFAFTVSVRGGRWFCGGGTQIGSLHAPVASILSWKILPNASDVYPRRRKYSGSVTPRAGGDHEGWYRDREHESSPDADP